MKLFIWIPRDQDFYIVMAPTLEQAHKELEATLGAEGCIYPIGHIKRVFGEPDEEYVTSKAIILKR